MCVHGMRVYGLTSIRVYCFLPCSSSSFSLSIGGHRSQGNFWLTFDAGCLPVDSDFELQDPEAPLRLSVKGQPSQKQYNVFVYGSLLPDLHNHWLISNAEFLGYHKTQPNFDMFSLGQFPAVCGGGHTAISGALYRVTRGTRDKLDLLEQHPTWYRREQVELLTNRPTLAWMYLMSREEPEIKGSWVKSVPSGDWFTYFTARQANALGHHLNANSELHALNSDG